jgi:hypothetical protein
MKKSELFTKENGSVIWFTKTDFEAEFKYPDTRPCNA